MAPKISLLYLLIKVLQITSGKISDSNNPTGFSSNNSSSARKPGFTCWRSTIEILEQCVIFVQS